MSFLQEESTRTIQENVDAQKKQQILPEVYEVDQNKFNYDEDLKTVLKIASQVELSAESSLVQLQNQSEQITQIHFDALSTNQNLKQSENLLRGMKNWWTVLKKTINPFSKYMNQTVVQSNNTDNSIDYSPPKIQKEITVNEKNEFFHLGSIVSNIKNTAQAADNELQLQLDELKKVDSLITDNQKKIKKQENALKKL